MKDETSAKGIVEHAKARSSAVVDKVDLAKKAIEKDIDVAGGIYPFNGGRLSRAEVCRRAGISSSILDGPSHKKSTLRRVNAWLATVNASIAQGTKRVRKVVTERAEALQQLANLSANQSHLYHLQMISLENELKIAKQKIIQLENKIASLESEISGGRVISLRPREGSGPKK